MRNALRNYGAGVAFLALTWGASAAVYAGSTCDLVTRGEAARLLGVPAGEKLAQDGHSKTPGCLIRAAGGEDTLELRVATIAPDDTRSLLQHADDERGEEVPSLHDEPWYQVSAPDPKHPNDRRLVIHRDHTSLTLDLHSSHQRNAKQAFEKLWYKIAERLPAEDEKS